MREGFSFESPRKTTVCTASPLITVIIPTFNRAELLKQTLDSVLGQSYDSWEAVVVDDGSSDGTVEVLANYERRDARIKAVTRSRLPKGASTCRNIGLAVARGEYVVFLDSDDLLATTCLAERVAAMEQNPKADFMAFQGFIFHEKPHDSQLIWNTENEASDLARFLCGDAVWNMNGPIWRTTSVKKLGGFDEQLGCWQDVDIHLRALMQGLMCVKHLNTPPDHFVRRHQMSSMSQNGFKSRETIGSILQVYEKASASLASDYSNEVKSGRRYMLAHAVQYALDNRYFDLAAEGIRMGRRDRLLKIQRQAIWNLAYSCYVIHSKGVRGCARIGKRLMASSQPKFLAARNHFLPGEAAMIASFDVFDTCLTRDLAVPTDVFYEVGRRVLVHLKLPVTDATVEDFVAARCHAYEAVRTQGGAEDVLLPKIWERLCDHLGWTFAAALWELELAVEAEHLFVVEKTKALVADLRRKGNHIVFTSDIYLPPEFVERLLTERGFFQPGDGLYTSGAVGKMKRTGNLFRHLLAVEKVRPAQVTHYGDDELSDGRVPRGLGINVVILAQGRLGRTEQALLREQGAGHPRITRVAGGIRKFRAATAAGENDEFTELVAGFVGPVTLGFAAWTLAQARRDGIQRLYFLSRDCQLAHKTAEILASKQSGEVECRYLFHSRQALFFALATAIDEKELWWLRRDFEIPVLERLLAKLELEYDSVAASFDQLAGGERGKYVLKSEADWGKFWTALNMPPLRDRLLQMFAQRREAALAFFEAEGLFEPVPWALVDLGWYLSCQEALQKLLKQRGRNEPMRGYYLGLKAGRLSEAQAGPARGLFYERAHDRQTLTGRQTIFSHIVPLEFVLGIADHPTVQRFEKNGAVAKPVFRGGQLNEAESGFAKNLQEATLSFVRMNVELAEQFQDEAATRLMLGAVLDRFALHPDRELVAPLQKINAAADQNLLDARPLIAPLKWGDALRMALPGRLRGRFAKEEFWIEGSIAVSSQLIRGMSMFQRRLKRLVKRTKS